MCSDTNKKTTFPEGSRLVFPFSFPKLHTGKNWYIDFYYFDVALECRRRKKVMLDGIPNKKLRRQRANELIGRLYEKLASGWNPFDEDHPNREYTLFSEVLDKYIDHVEGMDRRKTVLSYSSRVNILREFMASLSHPPKYCYEFNAAFVIDFLDWLRNHRDVSARTYNNYRGWISSLAEFMVLRKFISANPAVKIPKLRQDPKKRQALSPQMLKDLYKYLSQHDKNFLLACMMQYYTFIRPSDYYNKCEV